MILLSISQGIHALVVLFLISRGEEDDITPDISGVCTLSIIFFLISKGGEDEMTPKIAGGVHPLYDIVLNIQGVRG